MPERAARRWATRMAAGGAIGAALFALAACGGGGSSTSPAQPGPEPAGQWVFQQQMIHDRGALFEADVYRNIPATAQAKQPIIVEVEVCGPTSRCPAKRAASSSATATASPSVPTMAGAMISAQLEADPRGHIDSSPNSRQPVIAKTDFAQWRWWLHADDAGPLHIHISLTPLEGDTTTPLLPPTVIDDTINVVADVKGTSPSPLESPSRPSVAHRAWSVWQWVAAVAAALGGLGTAVGAVAGAWTAIRGARSPGNVPPPTRAGRTTTGPRRRLIRRRGGPFR